MDPADRNLSARKIERRLLSALCAPGLDDKTRARIFQRLAAYKFASGDHQVIFQALLKSSRAQASHFRETLAARLTRLGFPDIDVGPIFTLEVPSAEQIPALLDRLTD